MRIQATVAEEVANMVEAVHLADKDSTKNMKATEATPAAKDKKVTLPAVSHVLQLFQSSVYTRKISNSTNTKKADCHKLCIMYL